MEESADPIAQAKALLRSQIRARRSAMDPSIRQDYGQAMAEHARAYLQTGPPVTGPIACTWSMSTEPPTDPLISGLLASGLPVVTPRIEDELTLAWIRTTAQTELVPGPLGIRTPIGSQRVDLARCAVIVLPALALDRFGTRLGQGGGYFDRALGELRPHALGGPLRIGMAFAAEVVARLPRQAHDQGVDLILTEEALTEVYSDYEG